MEVTQNDASNRALNRAQTHAAGVRIRWGSLRRSVLHQANRFSTVNQEIRGMEGHPGGRLHDLFSALCGFQSVQFLSILIKNVHRYVLVVQLSLSLFASFISLSWLSLPPLCLLILKKIPINTLLLCCWTLRVLHTLAFSHTQTHNSITYKQPWHAEKLLQKASQYKRRWHILQPEFMSSYLLKGRERTWKGGRLNKAPVGTSVVLVFVGNTLSLYCVSLAPRAGLSIWG